jgi:hypothetical protein
MQEVGQLFYSRPARLAFLRLTPSHVIEAGEEIGHHRVTESGAVVQTWTEADKTNGKKEAQNNE